MQNLLNQVVALAHASLLPGSNVSLLEIAPVHDTLHGGIERVLRSLMVFSAGANQFAVPVPSVFTSGAMQPWYEQPVVVAIAAISVAVILILIAYAIHRYFVLEKLMVDRTKNLTEVNLSLQEEHAKLVSMLNDKSFLVEIASTLNSTASTYDEIVKILSLLNRKMQISHLIITGENDEGDSPLSSIYLITSKGVRDITDECSNFPMSLLTQLKTREYITCAQTDKLEHGENNFFYANGIKSVCVYPSWRFKVGMIGLVGFGRPNRNDWGQDEVEMLKAVTGMLLNAWMSYREFYARLAAEKKQTEAVKLAEKSVRMASIGVIAAGITHEINQPLNDIKIAADSVLIWNKSNSGFLPDNYRRWLDSISSNVNRISEIIEQMRTYWSSPEELVFNPLDVNEAVRHAVTLVDQQLKAHNIILKIEDSAPSLVIEGNRVNFEQVILNLVVNAIHALDTVDIPEKIIEISIDSADEQAMIIIKDNGPGLPVKNMQKIFDPFYTTRNPRQGMGLGLAIVKRFIDGFGGDIQAGNCEFGGACFKITIPLFQQARND